MGGCIIWIYFRFFFFSSRRRHTRSLCDWSSDVCSSDLPIGVWRQVVVRRPVAWDDRPGRVVHQPPPDVAVRVDLVPEELPAGELGGPGRRVSRLARVWIDRDRLTVDELELDEVDVNRVGVDR